MENAPAFKEKKENMKTINSKNENYLQGLPGAFSQPQRGGNLLALGDSF